MTPEERRKNMGIQTTLRRKVSELQWQIAQIEQRKQLRTATADDLQKLTKFEETLQATRNELSHLDEELAE